MYSIINNSFNCSSCYTKYCTWTSTFIIHSRIFSTNFPIIHNNFCIWTIIIINSIIISSINCSTIYCDFCILSSAIIHSVTFSRYHSIIYYNTSWTIIVNSIYIRANTSTIYNKCAFICNSNSYFTNKLCILRRRCIYYLQTSIISNSAFSICYYFMSC